MYQKNYGFGRDFLPFEAETKKEKMDKAKKREEYSKMIKERNTFLNDNLHYGKFTNTYANQEPLPTKRNQVNGQTNRFNQDSEFEQPRRNKIK